jgi:hypothetical protein
MKNNHLTPLEEKTLETISESLSELQGAISSHVKPLTPKERQRLLKMGNKTLAFVKKAYEFCQENPQLRPNFLSMDEFEKDYQDAQGLFGTINMTTQLRENLVDIQMVAGSEAFQAALIFYSTVKTAAAKDVINAKVIYEELRKALPHGRRRKRLVEPAPQTDEIAV